MTAISSQYSGRRLQRKIRGLRRTFEECDRERRPGKRRFAQRDYLEAVYVLFAKIGAGVLGTEVAKKLAEIYDIATRENAGLIRAIIDASATNLDPKMASRWTRALKFVWRDRQHWTDWRAFVDSHDGIAGCAQAFAKAKKDSRASAAQRAIRDVVAAKQRTGMRKRIVLTETRSSAQAKLPLAFPDSIGRAKSQSRPAWHPRATD
jgi:hypothetical protein